MLAVLYVRAASGASARLAPGFTPVKEVAQRVVAVNLEGGHFGLIGLVDLDRIHERQSGTSIYKERIK